MGRKKKSGMKAERKATKVFMADLTAGSEDGGTSSYTLGTVCPTKKEAMAGLIEALAKLAKGKKARCRNPEGSPDEALMESLTALSKPAFRVFRRPVASLSSPPSSPTVPAARSAPSWAGAI